jgi:hypothetical protein
MEGMALFRDAKPIDFTIPNLVDFPAKRVPDLLLKKVVNPTCRLHRLSVLFYIIKPFTTDQRTNRHDGTGECPTCFSLSGYAPGQGTSRFHDFFASYF